MKTIEKFLADELAALKAKPNVTLPKDTVLEDEIFRLVLSKKFRKYSVADDVKQKIKNDVRARVAKKEPLHFVCWQGSFKLWRLDVAPEADWAELFSLMRLVSWLKPVLTIYNPGIVFEFAFDDLIVTKICNYTVDEVRAYQRSFQSVLDFVMKHAPKNLKVKITPSSSCYGGETGFWKALDVAVSKWDKLKDIKVSPARATCIDLNYRAIAGEKLDELWRERNTQIHDAYCAMDDDRVKRDYPHAIIAALYLHPGWNEPVAIGSTKDSVVKHWIGVGALRPRGDSFMPTVLSPSQLASAKFDWHDVTIKGLDGENFRRIRVLK